MHQNVLVQIPDIFKFWVPKFVTLIKLIMTYHHMMMCTFRRTKEKVQAAEFDNEHGMQRITYM
jgi:hypothetical protein